LVLFDAGLRTGIKEVPEVGVYLSKTGYDVLSVEGGDEVYGTERINYIDAVNYLKTNKSLVWRNIFAVGLSSGGVVALKLGTDDEGIGIKGIVVVDSYFDLIEMWYYGKEYLQKTDPKNPRRKVFESYFKYAEERGVDPEKNAQDFYLASPKSFYKDVRLPVLIIHGVKDEITPIEQGIKLYEALKNENRNVKFKIVVGEGIHSPGIFSSFENFWGIMQTICAARVFMEELKERNSYFSFSPVPVITKTQVWSFNSSFL
jgi:esterase/lipase